MALFDHTLKIGETGKRTLFGAPPGHDARVLAELALQAGNSGVIAVASDDMQAATLADQIAFFSPGLRQYPFPAWDCLPYDRVSPSADIMALRAGTLAALTRPQDKPFIVITTVNALAQKLPPRAAFASQVLELKVGSAISREDLQAFLIANGYRRTTTVREPGDFALRGDIADLFPPEAAQPVRIDFFDTTVESLKHFDAMTQLTTGAADLLRLERVAELVLSDENIARFRTNYRELFGAQLAEDPLYQAVSDGRAYAGVEHWLPLFYAQLAVLTDYAPQATMALGWQTAEAATARWAQVEDFYQARAQIMQATKKDRASLYKPVPPGQLYLDDKSLQAIFAGRQVLQFSPFAPAGAGPSDIDGGGHAGRDFAPERQQAHASVYQAALGYLAEQQGQQRRAVIATYSRGAAERLLHVLTEQGATNLQIAPDFGTIGKWDKKVVALAVLPVEAGFVSRDLAVVTEQDLLGDRLARPRTKKSRKRSDEFVIDLGSLNEGDLVVHDEHGIGRFDGLITLEVGGDKHDCLRLVYSGGDRLFVPVENLDLLSRYGAGNADENATGNLDKLGGAGWQARKSRVKKRLKDMADALLKIAAARELQDAPVAEPPAGLYDEFAARFPYAETEDQGRAIDQIIDDLKRGRPMDRLVCGDVGFGKTEVALRAAFVAASNGLQVAVVVPTTLLARQHTANFERRFHGFPLRIAQLSRFVAAKDAKLVKEDLAQGKVDIVIGTHALLASSIRFANLGLVIVDEEQHFGVKQKEKLKDLQKDVHVLTLSATPIPRTMQLALTGVRELSLIATPPVDRLAVRTTVLPYDPLIVREALMREHYRGGQSFYVSPRLEDLNQLAETLRGLVPELRFVMAHGQMAATQLDEIMTAFDAGQYDILLATNIIESGLDIPRANTIVIHRADMFGLSQLYQLRGRVGRAKQRGYAYLTYPQNALLTATAEQRLKVMETLDQLGAGFQLASHDLDIRGAGNLLGEEQSGHIREVGIELYQQMLKEAVEAARRGESVDMPAIEGWSPTINLAIPVLIPESFVADLALRLSLYRRLADLKEAADVDAFAAELVDRFGPLPKEVANLLSTVEIKIMCKRAGIEKLDAGPNGGVIAFRHSKFAAPDKLIAFIQHGAGTLRIRPDMKLVAVRVWDNGDKRLAGVKGLLNQLLGLLPESKRAA